MLTVNAYAAPSADAPLEPTTITRRAVGPNDVLIEIAYAGICHSDIHTVNGDWGPQPYPLVPGHEIVGEVVRAGSRAKKSSAGYDLTRLLVGSEGTLGVITELTLKVHPLPEAVSAAVCFFPSIDAAVRTAMQVIQIGVPIARCELLDANAIRAVNAHDRLGLKEAPMLLMAGGADAIVDPSGSRDFYANAPEDLRTLAWFDNGYHEIFNEAEPLRSEVFGKMTEWLASRI